jgi:hypothetical protein
MREEGGQERSSNGHQRRHHALLLSGRVVQTLFQYSYSSPIASVWGATMVQRRLHTLLYYEVIHLGARRVRVS